MLYSFNEEGGRQTLTGRPSAGVVGGVVCVATDLLFVETVWLPIDVVPLQTLGGVTPPSKRLEGDVWEESDHDHQRGNRPGV